MAATFLVATRMPGTARFVPTRLVGFDWVKRFAHPPADTEPLKETASHYSNGIRSLFAASHSSKVRSAGLSDRATSGLRAPQ